MAYTLQRLGGLQQVTVPDNGVTPIANITLPGKNYLGYGAIVDQALLNITENFASSTEPASAIAGQIWYDTTIPALKYNTGTGPGPGTWVQVAAFGGNVVADGVTANVIDAGNITANNISGGNISGNIGGTLFYKVTFNASGAGVANNPGNIYDAASNIVVSWNTVGAAAGNATGWANVGLGPVPNSNVKITGGTNGQVLTTDGTGILTWTTVNTSLLSNGTSNVAVAASGNVTVGIAGTSNVLTVTATGINVAGTINGTGNANLGNIGAAGGIFNYVTGDGGNLSNIAGANVIGNVTSAITANFANFAGNITVNAQPNITSVGTLTSLAVTGDAAAGNFTTAGNVVAVGNIQADTGFISNSLTTRTGPLTLTATGTSNLTLAVGTGNIYLSTPTNITNVKDPVSAQDAATKNYVDLVAQGLKPKTAVNCATSASITLTAPGATIDGYTLVTNDRVLVKDQATPSENGIYIYDGAALVRATDADSSSELADGTFVFVESGSTYAASGFVQTATVTTLGTDPVVFTQFSAGGSYTAGTGLTLTGSQFSVSTTGVTAASYGNATHVPSFTVTATGQLTAALSTAVIANAETLAGTTLKSTIVNSSLTSLGTLTTLSVTGAATAASFAGDGGNLSNIPGPNIVGPITTTSISAGATGTAGTLTGQWTLAAGSTLNATYADLAERHHADAEYPVGTVMTVGGVNEITVCPISVTPIGVVSEQYAYLMNADAGPDETHPAIGYLGRVPVRVIGPITKHQRIAPAGNGTAVAADKNSFGWALETNNNPAEKLVLCVIK